MKKYRFRFKNTSHTTSRAGAEEILNYTEQPEVINSRLSRQQLREEEGKTAERENSSSRKEHIYTKTSFFRGLCKG